MITFDNPKNPAITKLTVVRMVDVPGKKIVKVATVELPKPIILWQGAAYDAIGQWTDADVEARLKELYNN
jgi:hypothetical protein